MNGFKYALTFTIGATVGSIVTWKLLKTKYEQFAQEEIDSVKEVFARRKSLLNNNTVAETEDTSEDDADEREYEDVVNQSGYVNYSDIRGNVVKKEDRRKINTKPYVITPADFGDKEDYECHTLRYYADGILTDVDNEVIEDVDNTVGLESLTTFGDYEDDCVYVRNEAKNCDYEILLDEREYSEVFGENPHLAED